MIQQLLMPDAAWIDVCVWNIRNLSAQGLDRVANAVRLLHAITAQIKQWWTMSGRPYVQMSHEMFQRLLRGVREAVDLVEETFA